MNEVIKYLLHVGFEGTTRCQIHFEINKSKNIMANGNQYFSTFQTDYAIKLTQSTPAPLRPKPIKETMQQKETGDRNLRVFLVEELGSNMKLNNAVHNKR